MSNIDFTALLFTCVFLTLIVGTMYKLKTKNPMIAFRHLQNNGAMFGISIVIVFAIVAAILTFGVNSAKAETPTYLNYTEFYFGIDNEISTNIFCYEDDINDRLVSNVGVDQNLLTYKTVDINIKYQHHSCALNTDKPTYDSIGLTIKYRINWN